MKSVGASRSNSTSFPTIRSWFGSAPSSVRQPEALLPVDQANPVLFEFDRDLFKSIGLWVLRVTSVIKCMLRSSTARKPMDFKKIAIKLERGIRLIDQGAGLPGCAPMTVRYQTKSEWSEKEVEFERRRRRFSSLSQEHVHLHRRPAAPGLPATLRRRL